MSKNSMSIQSWKNLAVKMPAWTSMLLRANHGVGKSKIVRQVSHTIRANLIKTALENTVVHDRNGRVINLDDVRKFLADNGEGDFYPFIDRRLSQMTEGDMIGLPNINEDSTKFNPPDWYKLACDRPAVLFLDEINRATPEIMQAAFQIVLDRELNGWQLHPLTRVYAAINDSSAYTVNEMDPALLDRFFVTDLEPSLKEWCAWARNDDPVHGGNLHHMFPDFIEGNQKHDGTNWLTPPKKCEAGGVHPSPRSWESLHSALVHAGIMEQPDSELFYHFSMGFVGVEAAIAFSSFCKTYDTQVSGEDIVEKYHNKAIRKAVKRKNQSQFNELIERVADYVIKNEATLTEQQGKNMNTFMTDMPDELRISLWTKLTSHGVEKLDLAKWVHKYCSKLVLDVFGVPFGEAGVGHVPNIPGILKTPADNTGK